MKINWTRFKSIKEIRAENINFLDKITYYEIWANSFKERIYTIIEKTNPRNKNQIDFEDNYKNSANKSLFNDNKEVDSDGRQIVKNATTKKGWHYQAHTVQFEVNKLNSVYNCNIDGEDLGYTTLKIYDDQGTECVTQGTADTDGVKTVVKWSPDFDFEIISGQIRQKVKETIDSYIYVRAMVATGLAAPNDFFPVYFTQGGINLNYIGADEILKTDGRSSKFFPAGTNGDHFEIVINYDADLLTNENRHEMCVIFEIYKDPMS